MRIPYMALLYAYLAVWSLFTGIRPNNRLKWYDRLIRIAGGVFLSGWTVLMILATRN
jgi:hypothetical protein